MTRGRHGSAPPEFRVVVIGQFVFAMVGETLYMCRLPLACAERR